MSDPYLDARLAGHSWPEIDEFVAGRSEAALAEGYDQNEIDRYLGYDNGDFDGEAAASWAAIPEDQRRDLASNPDLRGAYANAVQARTVRSPEDFIARYAMAAGRAEKADEIAALLPPERDFIDAATAFDDPATAKDNLIDHWRISGEPPISAVRQSFNDPDLRGQLETKREEPGFFDRLGAGVRDMIGGGAVLMTRLLPTGVVNAVNEANDYLADLGVPLARIGPEGLEAFETARINSLKTEGYDGWVRTGGQIAATLPLFTTLGFQGITGTVIAGATGGVAAAAFTPSEAENYWADKATKAAEYGVTGAAGGALLHGLFRGIGKAIGQMTPSAAKALGDLAGDAMNVRVDVLDPGGLAPVMQRTVAEAFPDIMPAPMLKVAAEAAEGAVEKIDPAASPASKLRRIVDMEMARVTGQDEFASPTFFQDLTQRSVERGTADADPALQALAEGHDAAQSFRRFAADLSSRLARDERGAMPLRTPEQIALADAKRLNRDYIRDLAVRTAGLRNDDISYWTDKIMPLARALQPHMDEWEKAAHGGIGARDTTIGKFMTYVEGRSQGITIDASNPLAPFADAVREVNQAIDKLLRQQAEAGVLKYDGYIQDYFAHMFANPSDVLARFGLGASKTGSRANLLERKGAPTLIEALEQGAQLRETDIVKVLLRDINAKLSYSHFADLIDQGVKDGMMRWGPKTLPGDVPIEAGGSLTRKIFPTGGKPGSLPQDQSRIARAFAREQGVSYQDAVKTLAEQGRVTPRTGEGMGAGEIKLYAHPDLVKNLNYWIGKTYFSDTTMSVLENALYMKNTFTGLKLAGPMFHMITVLFGSVSGNLGMALEAGARGQFGAALKDLAYGLSGVGAIQADWRAGIKGFEILAARGSERALRAATAGVDDRVIQSLIEQNFAFKGQHILESYIGRTPSIWKSIGAGRSLKEWVANPDLGFLPRELRADFRNILGDAVKETQAYRALRVPDRVLQAGITEMQRVLSTVNGPMFDNMVPALKLGQSMRRLDMYLKANPTATPQQIRAYSRQLTMDADNRIGELQLDNLFWPRLAKVLANISLISTSWVYSTYRNFAAAVGWDLERRAFAWNPIATTNVVGMLSSFAIANGLMTYMHTSAPPDSWRDWLNFRTGGIGSGLAKGFPERGMIPNELKELFDIGGIVAKSWHDWTNASWASVHYAMGKLNPFLQFLRVLTNEDHTDAIGHRVSKTPGGWGDFVVKAFEPIFVSQLRERSKDTGLNVFESFMGLREAPKWAEAWESFQGWQQHKENKARQEEYRRAVREAIQRGQDTSAIPAPDRAPSGGRGTRPGSAFNPGGYRAPRSGSAFQPGPPSRSRQPRSRPEFAR